MVNKQRISAAVGKALAALVGGEELIAGSTLHDEVVSLACDELYDTGDGEATLDEVTVMAANLLGAIETLLSSARGRAALVSAAVENPKNPEEN